MKFPSGNLSGTNPYNQLSRRTATTGSPPQSGSHGAYSNTRADSISLPPDPRELSSGALLKCGYVAQALIDSTAVLFGFLFLVVLILSVPLAVALMVLGVL